MHFNLSDNQIVGEVEASLFDFIQQGSVDAQVFLTNSGINTLNYRFQEFNGSIWLDLGLIGSDTYSTLMSGQTKSIKVTSNYSRVRLVGNASGGAILDFSVTRYFQRPSGGSLPNLP